MEKSYYTLVIVHFIHTYFEIVFSKYDLNSRDSVCMISVSVHFI